MTKEGAGNFRVKLVNSDHTVIARVAGRIIRYHVRIAANEKVLVELLAPVLGLCLSGRASPLRRAVAVLAGVGPTDSVTLKLQ